MRTWVGLVGVLFCGVAAAKPARPQLTPQAAAVLKAPGGFLIPAGNQVVPLDGKGKPVPLFAPAPQRLELVSVEGQRAILLVDEELLRLAGGAAERIAGQVGLSPSLSDDGKLIASLADKRTLELSDGESRRKVPYRRSGHWEFLHPFVMPAGGRVVVTVHDFSGADVYGFLMVDPASLNVEEIEMSRAFVPGPLREPLGPTRLAIPLERPPSDEEEENPSPEPLQLSVLDLKSKKIGPAPADLLPGVRSADGRFSLAPGAMRWRDDHRCGGDHTLLYEKGKPRPSAFVVGKGTVVSGFDFLPNSSGIIAQVLEIESCKARGVIIPTTGEVKPDKWKPFPLPSATGRLAGRVLAPAAKP
jgi:hypothetical protein